MSAKTSMRPAPAAGVATAVRRLGVVGAGTMGAGIAQKAALSGLEVVLVDVSAACLDKARAGMERLFAEGVARKALSPAAVDAAGARLKLSLDLAELAGADLIVEAVFEDPKVKRALFERLDAFARPETVFATNTSSLSVAELARATRRPERFVGLHYFYHPVKNSLLEVVPLPGTAPEARALALAYARATGKVPIETRDRPGFAVNRFFVPWLNEAVRIVAEEVGTEPQRAARRARLDAAAREAFGIGMGPFALMNATGVPIAAHAARGLAAGLSPFYAPDPALETQADSGKPWDIAQAGGEPEAQAAERLWGVVFWVAACLDAEKVARREDIDRGARLGLRWARGPFEEMNRRGAEAAGLVRDVCRRHRLPLPAAFAKRGRKPWPLRYVDTAREDGVARIVLNRPETLNALDETMVAQLAEAVAAAAADPRARGLVLESRAKAFVAGADVKFFVDRIGRGDLAAILRFTEQGHALLRALETCRKPVVALIDGPALGGGTELALACRYRVATPRALFRLPETGLGIYPGLGGTQRLPRLVGKELARWLILSGDAVQGQNALAAGLVDALLPPGEALDRAIALARGEASARAGASPPPPELVAARALFSDAGVAGLLAGETPPGEAGARAAKTLSRKAPLALRAAAELIERGLAGTLEAGLRLELSRLAEIFRTEDAREGLSALLEKRAPRFAGK